MVAAASYEARARGVYVPMPLTQAHRVCPDAIFLHGQFQNYSEFSERVFEVFDNYCPYVERASIDEGYMDWTVDQYRALFPRQEVPRHWPVTIAERLCRQVSVEVGLSVSAGIGANRTIAKIASKYCKPRGICHVAAGSEPAFLRPLKLKVVPGIGKKSTEALAACGLVTFADVQRLSKEGLTERAGEQWAERLSRLAVGNGNENLYHPEQPKSISNEHTFSIDCKDQAELDRTLYQLTEKAAWRLRKAGLKTGTVGIKLRTPDFKTITRDKTLGFKTDNHQEIHQYVMTLFTNARKTGQAVRLIGVRLSNLDEESNRQLELYDQQDLETSQKVDQLLDEVRQKMGFKKIGTAGSLPKGRVRLNE